MTMTGHSLTTTGHTLVRTDKAASVAAVPTIDTRVRDDHARPAEVCADA